MCLVQSIKHRMLCGKAAQTSCLRYTGEPRPSSKAAVWHATITMCRDPRHTFLFHVPEGHASDAEGALHVPEGHASYPNGVLHLRLSEPPIPHPQTSARCMAPRSLFRRQS